MVRGPRYRAGKGTLFLLTSVSPLCYNHKKGVAVRQSCQPLDRIIRIFHEKLSFARMEVFHVKASHSQEILISSAFCSPLPGQPALMHRKSPCTNCFHGLWRNHFAWGFYRKIIMRRDSISEITDTATPLADVYSARTITAAGYPGGGVCGVRTGWNGEELL